MREYTDKYFENYDISPLLDRYERMLKSRAKYYFDVHELESMFEYYIDQQDLELASKVVDLAIRLHPTSLDIQLKKAEYLVESNKTHEALLLLNQLENIEPTNCEILITKGAAFLNQGKLQKAINEFERCFTLINNIDYEFLFNIGIVLEQYEYYTQAIKYLERALELAPDNLTILYELGYCYEKNEENEKSIFFYERYLDAFPFSDDAWYNLGIAYSKLDLYHKAIAAYEFAIAINPSYSSALYNKANALANEDSYELAIEAYNEFLFLEPDNESALCYIGECYQKMDDYINALAYYKKALEINEYFADAWYGIGLVLMNNERIAESLFFVTKAINIDPQNSDYWYTLGNINSELSFYDDALTAYNTATQLDPYDFESWLNSSYLIFANDHLQQAIDCLSDGYVHNPDNAEINYRIAAYYLHHQNEELAYFHLENALTIDDSKYRDFLDFCPDAKAFTNIGCLLDKYHIL